ncbi:Hypothetical protein PENO1_038890 [Penicillium occitanis (nom. inval.)]|nr:Hypothetical protein PENO1_038890 [Penicillium occitanis (nom. inval.)]PCH03664.1 hypothetical protein PENOC_037520 [Penicillium occitanis (nom. inval.)]
MSATSTISSRSNLLGPLTTTWSAPEPCQSAWIDCESCGDAWQGQDCLDDGSNSDALTCWPPVAETTADLQPPFLGLGFYSPGLACPVGYETACAMSGASNGLQQTISGQQQFQFDFAPTAGETVIGCCPSGYACASNIGQTCSLQIASTTEPLLTCSTGASTITTSVVLPETVTTTASSSIVGFETISQFVIWAPLFQLNYQATDLPTSSSLSTAPVTDTTALPSNTTSSDSSGSSSSHTTTIAVAVTVPVVIVALIAAVLGWWFWRKRASAARGSYAAPPPPGPDDIPTSPTELSSHTALAEMAIPNNPVPPVEMSQESSVPKPLYAPAVHEMGA